VSLTYAVKWETLRTITRLVQKREWCGTRADYVSSLEGAGALNGFVARPFEKAQRLTVV
jgi:hypothetical protein